MSTSLATAVARIERHSDSRPNVFGRCLFFETKREARNAQRILKEFGQESWLTEKARLYVG